MKAINSQPADSKANPVEAHGPLPRLVVVSGPSGVGKGPIIEAIKKLYLPELCEVKVRKRRTERHSEHDPAIGFEDMGKNIYEFDCRGSRQAIGLDNLDEMLAEKKIVLMETYYTSLGVLRSMYEHSVNFISVFISPLNPQEMLEIQKKGETVEDYLKDVMTDAILTRAMREGKSFTSKLIAEVGKRASIKEEICSAANYSFVIPNHCYESSPLWKIQPLIGEAKLAVDTLHEIITTGASNRALKGGDYSFLTK
jgi:guanylate kinase